MPSRFSLLRACRRRVGIALEAPCSVKFGSNPHCPSCTNHPVMGRFRLDRHSTGCRSEPCEAHAGYQVIKLHRSPNRDGDCESNGGQSPGDLLTDRIRDAVSNARSTSVGLLSSWLASRRTSSEGWAGPSADDSMNVAQSLIAFAHQAPRGAVRRRDTETSTNNEHPQGSGLRMLSSDAGNSALAALGWKSV